MSVYPIQPITLGAVRTYPLASRKSKVSVREFAKAPAANGSITRFLDSLPAILAGNDLREVAAAIRQAQRRRGCASNLQEIAPIPKRAFALHSLRLLYLARSFDRVRCLGNYIWHVERWGQQRTKPLWANIR